MAEADGQEPQLQLSAYRGRLLAFFCLAAGWSCPFFSFCWHLTRLSLPDYRVCLYFPSFSSPFSIFVIHNTFDTRWMDVVARGDPPPRAATSIQRQRQ